MIDSRVGTIHARYQTPSAAVLGIGLATAACMLLGDAILVPITEVGSVACAIGWSAACAACLALARAQPGVMNLSAVERAVAWFGLAVGIAMALMKVVPLVPGHFTAYEWLAWERGSFSASPRPVLPGGRAALRGARSVKKWKNGLRACLSGVEGARMLNRVLFRDVEERPFRAA